MGLFNRKTEVPLLCTFFIKINLDAVELWLNKQRKVEPIPDTKWEEVNTKEYEIQILPTDPFTFYHKQINTFSPSIGGIQILMNAGIESIL